MTLRTKKDIQLKRVLSAIVFDMRLGFTNKGTVGKTLHGFILSTFLIPTLSVPTSLTAQTKLSTSDAKKHVGETAIVCGIVASTHFAAASHRSPTFLNLDEPYPHQTFTIVIWGSDRFKFGNPERTYASKYVCVSGQISEYKRVPEIQVSDPKQIQAQK